MSYPPTVVYHMTNILTYRWPTCLALNVPLNVKHHFLLTLLAADLALRAASLFLTFVLTSSYLSFNDLISFSASSLIKIYGRDKRASDVLVIVECVARWRPS